MSSNQSEAAAVQDVTTKRRRPMTLRSKLIAAFVVAIIAVSVVIGVVTQVFLSDYLVKQLDARVDSTQGRFGGPRPPDQGEPGLGGTAPRFDPAELVSCTDDDDIPGAPGPDNSVIALISPDADSLGTVSPGTPARIPAVVRGSFSSCTVLDAGQATALTGVGVGQPAITVKLGDAGDFRVVAWQTGDGRVMVSGLSMAEVQGTQLRLTVVMAVVAGVAVILGALAVGLVIRRSTRPLERVAATARQVSTLPLDRGEVDLGIRVPAADTDPRTEVGQVGAALNQMLGHVSEALTARHESENQVRRFVADASHELRTPLAAIRGYAELAGRNPDDTDAVRHSLGRVHSESERMSTLVDDLLLLARLDSGRPLDTDPVDLSALSIDVVSDARAAGPEHRWQLELPPEPIVASGDAHRLHQLVANLLANARTHTPPGTTVITTLRTERSMAVLTIADDGPGIDAELQTEIFGRFVRGDQSRSRAAGSTGLGLAIVSAVAAAHHGAVAVNSRSGWTVFTVRLPLDSGVTDPGADP